MSWNQPQYTGSYPNEQWNSQPPMPNPQIPVGYGAPPPPPMPGHPNEFNPYSAAPPPSHHVPYYQSPTQNEFGLPMPQQSPPAFAQLTLTQSNQSNRLAPSRSGSYQSSAVTPHMHPSHKNSLPPPGGAVHACISLNMTDRLRLIKFPAEVQNAMRIAILQFWVRGIQSERLYAGAHEFKLSGNPWSGQGSEAVPSRQLMAGIFSCLYHHGYELVASTDVSKKGNDKDSLIFRRTAIPSPCSFFAISFNEGDKLRLIQAPNDVINCVKRALGGLIQREDWKVQSVAYQFKLLGNPWWASGDEAVTTRVTLLNILDALTTLGWELHASIDMSAGTSGTSASAADTDTWFLRRPTT